MLLALPPSVPLCEEETATGMVGERAPAARQAPSRLRPYSLRRAPPPRAAPTGSSVPLRHLPPLQATAKDAASSSSPSASAFPDQVLAPSAAGRENMANDQSLLGTGSGGQKSSIYDHHFELGTTIDCQRHMTFMTLCCLDISSDVECNKGFSVCGNESFTYKPKEEHVIYISEVGLSKVHAKDLATNIVIYVALGSDELRITLGTLSKANPTLQLELLLPTEFILSHSSARKTVYFNAFELRDNSSKPMSFYPRFQSLDRNKSLWGAEVMPSQKAEFQPNVEEKKYHILKVFTETPSTRNVEVYAECKGIQKLLGCLSNEKTASDCRFEFDDTFQLSHSSNSAVVFFSGYTESHRFVLQDLTVDPSLLTEPLPPKEIVDTEYLTYKAVVAKTSGATKRNCGKTSGSNVPKLSPMIWGSSRQFY